MNGHPFAPIGPNAGARPVNQEAVKTLEGMLADARRGGVTSVAIIFSGGPNHVDLKINAQQPLELYLGCEMLRQTLFNFMTKPPTGPQSRIVRASPGMMGG